MKLPMEIDLIGNPIFQLSSMGLNTHAKYIALERAIYHGHCHGQECPREQIVKHNNSICCTTILKFLSFF